MKFYIKDFNGSQTLAFYIHENKIRVWGSAAPKLLSALPIPYINSSYKPNKMPTAENIVEVVLSNNNVIILSDTGDIGIIECQSDPWKPIECKDFFIKNVSALDVFKGTDDIICLVNNNRIVYKENKMQVKLPFDVKQIYAKEDFIILLTKNNDVYRLGISGIPQKIAENVCNVYSANGRIFLSILDHIFEINNSLSLPELPDLAGAMYVSDNIAIFSGGRVATFDKNCNINDYIDIPEKVISVYGFKGSFFAVGESKSIWVWGYNIGHRLGLCDNYSTFVEKPTFNIYI